ncbi:MAG: hypothetical protein ABIK09_15635, partial [Pseudomonadota bacterium]
MRTGQILTILGALGLIAAIFGLPVYEMPQQDPALVTELGFGMIMAGLAAAMALVVLIGYASNKAKQAAGLNVILASVLLSMVFYIGLSAPHLWAGARGLIDPSTPGSWFDDEGKFLGYLSAGAGFYVLWLGALLALAGVLAVVSAQPRYTSGTRFLRVALLWKGTIIREEVLSEGKTLTVGEDLKNYFPLETDFRSLPMFKYKSGRKNHVYELALLKEMDGKLHLGGADMDVSQAIRTKTSNTAAANSVEIRDGDWGVFKFGEVQLFFQFTQPAAAKTRKSIFDFDHAFVASVLLSCAVQTAFLLTIIVTPADMNYQARAKEAFAKMIRIETRRAEREKEEKKKELEEKKEEKKEEEKKEEEKVPDEVPEEQPPMPDKPLEKAGDPLKKDIDLSNLKKNQLKPIKDDKRGLDAKRDKLALDKKQGMVAILQNKSRKKSALSSILGKQKDLVAKNAVWGEDGDYVLENEGQSDLAYDGASLTTGDYGGGGLGGAGGFGDGGGGGGFGAGGAFGMGGMGGIG